MMINIAEICFWKLQAFLILQNSYDTKIQKRKWRDWSPPQAMLVLSFLAHSSYNNQALLPLKHGDEMNHCDSLPTLVPYSAANAVLALGDGHSENGRHFGHLRVVGSALMGVEHLRANVENSIFQLLLVH